MIDGSFSDWDDISKTDLTEPGDDGNVKRAAMVSDGTNLYIYVQMDYTNNYGYNHLQTDGYYLTVGGIQYYFTVRSPNGSNSLSNNLKNLGDKTALKIGLGSNYNGNYYAEPSNIEAEAARIANNAGSPTDTMEIKIPLSDFTLSSQSGQIITLKNSNLGSQTVTVSGGSTGPIILAVIGLVIALLGLWKFKSFRKRKKGWVNR
ncbi:Firmicu-CTERM sorting domain-containing protein [Liquorilactobacillus mali]|nr:Firmicu-CTERM sorting domain-containing protein [Liquorilactobacillus mali]